MFSSDFRCASQVQTQVRTCATGLPPANLHGKRSMTPRTERAPNGVQSDEGSGRVGFGRACSPGEVIKRTCRKRRPRHLQSMSLNAQTGQKWRDTDHVAAQTFVLAVTVRTTALAIGHIHGTTISERHLQRHRCIACSVRNCSHRECGDQHNHKYAHVFLHNI